MAFNLFGKKKEPKFKSAPEKEEQVVSAEQMPSIVAPSTSNILKSFYISEKSARGQALNQFTFIVAPKATKSDVKHAVQRAYKVNVIDVHIIRLPSKQRTVGRYMGTKAGVKKAIVVLKNGQTIAQAQP